MRKILFIIPLGLSLTAMSCVNNTQEQTTTIQQEQEKEVFNKSIQVNEFAELLSKGEGQVLDVRTPEEWASGTIRGAQKMNFFDKDFTMQLNKLDKKRVVFVYCKSGGRSGKVATQLAMKGFTVYNLIGGFTAWKAAGKSSVNLKD
jgi:rhodanese-related sulfurtransferase